MSIRGVSGGITSAEGFTVGVGDAGIRDSGGPDLVVIASDRPASAAATFTTNRMRAAPVLLAEESLAASSASTRAIVVNAGCARWWQPWRVGWASERARCCRPPPG